MLSGCFEDSLLNIKHQSACLSGEELHFVLSGLVGAQKAVEFVAPASVNRCVHDLVEAADHLGAIGHKDSLCALSGVDIAVENMVRIFQDRLGLVCKNDLALRSALTDEVSVILYIIHAGELMLVDAEELSVFFQSQDIAVRIDSRLIDLVEAHKFISHFVGRIAEHQNDLLSAHCDPAQADRESVAGKDREDNADGAASKLSPDILRNIFNGAVITLCPRDN